MIKFPVFERLVVSDYRLFPGLPDQPGIDFLFKNGVSLVAGVNGLGKTTLINMMYRLLVGPWELPKDTSTARFGGAAPEHVVEWFMRRRFFAQRVADQAQDATATLEFHIGTQSFQVCRELSTCRLREAFLAEEPLPSDDQEEAYQNALYEAAGLGSFVDFLTVVKYLTFFNEERRDILWDDQAQRQFFRILFVPPQEAVRWSKLEGEISRSDSRARNASAIATRMSRDLMRMEQVFRANVGVAAELAAAQRILDADNERKERIEEEIDGFERELRETRRDLERAKLFHDEALRELEEIRFGALQRLFPNICDTATYILTHLFAEGRCLACEADSPREQRKFELSLETGSCVICGAPPGEQRRIGDDGNVAPPTDLERRRLVKAREAVANARVERDALLEKEKNANARWHAGVEQLATVTRNIAAQTRANAALRARLPPEPAHLEQRRQAISVVRSDEETAKHERRAAEHQYEALLQTLTEEIQRRTESVTLLFQTFAGKFLEETCSLTFRMIRDRPSQGGEYFRYPSLKFEMTAAAFEGQQIRESPEDVSESQREFIDLAFRMALAIVASEDAPATLVMETPEASLDVISMTKAAELLTDYAHRGRRVIVTSNLTNSAMIPALLGGPLKPDEDVAERWKRVLNLLKLAAPNAAVRNFGDRYDKFLMNAVEGRLNGS